MNNEQLKPCPLCGGDVNALFDVDYYTDCDFQIKCDKCNLRLCADGTFVGGGELKIDQKYIDIWNNR